MHLPAGPSGVRVRERADSRSQDEATGDGRRGGGFEEPPRTKREDACRHKAGNDARVLNSAAHRLFSPVGRHKRRTIAP
jgi:hypothetical protein